MAFCHCGSRRFAMRWILVVFVACVAVASANLYEDDDNAYDDEQQNNIDIFLPRSLNKVPLDKANRAFYYNYWLYPAMAFKPRRPSTDMGPFMDYVEPLTFQDVFEKPVLVVTPSQNAPNTFSMFYLHNGLRTLHRYQAFSWLQEFFKHPGLKGLIFYPHLIYNMRFFETPITGVTFPEDLRMSDFVSIENCNSGRIPYMFVAQEDLFDRMHFENIAKVSDFKVYNDAIEVHPVIPEPRPLYEPFYGPKPFQAQQYYVAAQQQHVAPTHSGESAMNAMDFGSGHEGSFERPPVLAHQAGSLAASQAGRGVYGGAGYGLEEQYGYGKNQAVNGQYYGQRQSGFVKPEGYRAVNAGQVSSSSYQQISKTGAGGVGADLGAYGTLMGVSSKSAIMPSSEARFGVVQGQLQAEGQVHGASKGSGYMKLETEGVTGHGSQVGISRTQETGISGQLSGVEGTQLTGALGTSVKKTEDVVRTHSGIAQGQEVTATTERVSIVDVSGQQQEAGSVSRVDLASGLEGSVGVQLQRGEVSGVQVGSVSRTGAQSEEHSTVSQSGHYGVHSSGPLISENLAKTEAMKIEGGAIGLGGLGGKFGFSGNVGSGLLGRFGSGVVNTIDVTTQGLGAELLRHHEGQLERFDQPVGVSSSSTVSKSVVTTYGPTQSSVNVESKSVEVAKPVTSSTRTLVSSARSLSEEDLPAVEPVIMSQEA